MSPDSVDTIYNAETRAETSASMQLTVQELKKKQRMVGLKGKPSPKTATRDLFTSILGHVLV